MRRCAVLEQPRRRRAYIARLVGRDCRGRRRLSHQSWCGPEHSVVTALRAVLPGTLLLAAIGFAGKLTEQSIASFGRAHQMTLPNIEYVLWAILIGLVISNTVGVPEI